MKKWYGKQLADLDTFMASGKLFVRTEDCADRVSAEIAAHDYRHMRDAEESPTFFCARIIETTVYTAPGRLFEPRCCHVKKMIGVSETRYEVLETNALPASRRLDWRTRNHRSPSRRSRRHA